MTARRFVGFFWTALLAVTSALLAIVLAIGTQPAERAAAACTEETQDVTTIFTVAPPANNLTLQGSAPFQVIITMQDTTLLTGPMTMSFNWGDGSSTPVNIVSCGVDDLYNILPQQLAHTYTNAGVYVLQWHINSQVAGQFSSLAVIVTVTGAEPTPVPPTPTAVPATPTTAPTQAPAGATATPQPTAAGVTTSPSPEASPSASPSPSASSTATSAAPPPPAATPTPTPVPQAPATGRLLPPPPPAEPGRPETIRALPDITDVSTDGGVVATNLVLAGVTIWVFFSSVLFNQTLQSHRSEVSAWFAGIRKPLKRLGTARVPFRTTRWLTTAAVLLGMGVIYEFLEPGLGFNEASLVLFVSVVVGVGVVGYLFSSLEAWSRERTAGVDAMVQAYPLSLLVAAGSVLLSRVVDLQPGVVYGFAASCVVVSEVAGDARREGRQLIIPVVACLMLSVGCWLLVAPAREIPVGWVSHLLEAIAVIVFVGGLEGLLINLIPLDVMDGAKIYRWSRWVWAGLMAVCAFLFWHVLLNTERSSFDSLREASSATVLVGFALYTLAGLGLWALFKFRKVGPVPAPPGEAG